MSINPYEAPRTASDNRGPRAAVPVATSFSVLVVAAAGIAGGSLFLAALLCVSSLNAHTLAMPVAITCGIAASLLLLLTADCYIQRQIPAFWSAAIGILLASPVALFFSVTIAFYSYGMATKNVPGAWHVQLLAFCSFFLIISLGGWVGISLSRRRSRS